MTGFEWKIFVRSPDFTRYGILRQYIEAELKLVYNDVGTWSVLMNRQSPLAAELTQPGWGIIATRNGQIVLSGPATKRRHTVDMDSDQIEISGVTDEIWLRRRGVCPSPAQSAPPYDAQASDNRTGVASTVLRQYVDVNAGPGATSARRTPGLTIGTDPVAGASVAGNGRWQSDLLEFLQPLAVSGGIGFRVAQVGAGLEFQTFAPTDRSATVKFSVNLKNLAGFEYESTAPTANFVYVGATGTGSTRVIAESPDSASIADWGRIEGGFVNSSGTSNPTEIQQAGTDALTQGAEQAALTITPIETDTSMYGQHYFLGDKVCVQLEGPAATPYAESGQILDILRSVTIKLTVDGPQTVTPAIGTAARNDISRLFRAFRRVQNRVNNLERG
jgi:hypothetical protein